LSWDIFNYPEQGHTKKVAHLLVNNASTAYDFVLFCVTVGQ